MRCGSLSPSHRTFALDADLADQWRKGHDYVFPALSVGPAVGEWREEDGLLLSLGTLTPGKFSSCNGKKLYLSCVKVLNLSSLSQLRGLVAARLRVEHAYYTLINHLQGFLDIHTKRVVRLSSMHLPVVDAVPRQAIGVPPTEAIGVPPTEAIGVPPTEAIGVPPTEAIEAIGVPLTEAIGVPLTEAIAVTPTEAIGVPPTEAIGVPLTEAIAVTPTEALSYSATMKPLEKDRNHIQDQLVS
ncbi:hypothetical protein F7725_017629 [Dissostichus mawsoni]|uniref:Uncharacterized protein n=1 Tax=Dissostichus mawsoni TaxID=36200 RepID=A0A7J5Z5J7_DISMA|nr:hypothetical protein F7725_017629 [Dissostichus mawsoni]